MSIPGRIEIGPLVYRVRRADLDDFGRCDPDDFTILLRRRMSPETTREVLFHELLHACLAACDLDWSAKKEETVVKRLSPVLLDVLQRNDRLVEFLTEKK